MRRGRIPFSAFAAGVLASAAMTDDISELTARHTYGTWRAQRGWKPMHVTRAEGCHFWDASGKRYLDLSSQLICSNLGHQNQAVIDAICEQAKELAFIGPALHLRRPREARAQAARGHAQGPRQVLLRDVRHRGERGGHQDRPRGTRASTRSSRATPPTTARPPARSPRPATSGAGSSSQPARSRASSSGPRSTATAARSSKRTPRATPPAPTTSRT